MTGEITLRGRVLPVGGIKEKVLAAYRAGVQAVVLPRRNLRDLDDIASDVRNCLTFLPVERMDEVLDLVFSSRATHAEFDPAASRAALPGSAPARVTQPTLSDIEPMEPIGRVARSRLRRAEIVAGS